MRSQLRVRRTVTATLAAAALGSSGWCTGGVAAASAGHPIHPGAALTVSDNTCEVGYLVVARHHVYAAVPASCTGTDGGNGGDGCVEAQIPYGSRADITGARHKAILAYSSFTQMQLRGMNGGHACAANNLSLFRLSSADARRASPRVPTMGRPKRASHAAPATGAALLAYLSSGRATASAGGTSEGGWQHGVTINAAVSSADLGAPIMSPNGLAVGMETVLPSVPTVAGVGATSQVSDLRRELRFLRRHAAGFHHAHLLNAPRH